MVYKAVPIAISLAKPLQIAASFPLSLLSAAARRLAGAMAPAVLALILTGGAAMAETAPVQTAPVQTTPVQTAPNQTAPVQAAPAQPAPSRSAPKPGAGAAPQAVPGFWDPRRRPERPDLSRISVIRFLTETDYPPFNFTGADGNP